MGLLMLRRGQTPSPNHAHLRRSWSRLAWKLKIVVLSGIRSSDRCAKRRIDVIFYSASSIAVSDNPNQYQGNTQHRRQRLGVPTTSGRRSHDLSSGVQQVAGHRPGAFLDDPGRKDALQMPGNSSEAPFADTVARGLCQALQDRGVKIREFLDGGVVP